MAANLKRLTISITPTMELDLEQAKEKCYDKVTQNDMIKDLIIRGLEAFEKENKGIQKGDSNHSGRHNL